MVGMNNAAIKMNAEQIKLAKEMLAENMIHQKSHAKFGPIKYAHSLNAFNKRMRQLKNERAKIQARYEALCLEQNRLAFFCD